MRVDCLKGKECKNERISDDKRILINRDISIGIYDIPSLNKLDGKVHYTQIGMTIYIIYVDESEGITYMYMIEQGIENNEVKIENIYTTTIVAERNTLARFFRYDEEFERETLTTRLQGIIEVIPVLPEKEYLQRKIKEYLEEKEIKVQGKFEYKPLEKPSETPLEKPLEEKKPQQKRKQGTPREITYNGVTYPTVKSFADEYGLVYGKVIKGLYDGKTPERIIEIHKKSLKNGGLGRSDKIICYGVEYASKAEFARVHGLSNTTVISKLKKGKTPEEILEEKEIETRGGFIPPIQVVYKNEVYPSIAELARHLDIDSKKLSRIIKQGGDIEAEIDNYVMIQDVRKGYRKGLQYDYEGERFTIKELAELADIPLKTMWDRIIKQRWTVKEAVETPVIKKEEKINE